jgi:fido (protein-threonine AMPylation protein)
VHIVGNTQTLLQTGFANAVESECVMQSSEFESKNSMLLALEDQKNVLEYTWKFIKHNETPSNSNFKPQGPIDDNWFKLLHTELTRNQKYTVSTDSSGNDVRLLLHHGHYKTRENSPTTKLGFLFEYCPPHLVDSEMKKFYSYMERVLSDPNVPPEVAAAWIHYAYISIHPFEDGNGRIARLLASLVFVKANLVPLWIDGSDINAYFNALKLADQGNLQPLVDLFGFFQCRLINIILSNMHCPTSVDFTDHIGLVTPIIKGHLQVMADQFRTQVNPPATVNLDVEYSKLDILLAIGRTIPYITIKDVLMSFNACFSFTPSKNCICLSNILKGQECLI